MDMDDLVWAEWQLYLPTTVQGMAARIPGVYYIANHENRAIYIGQAGDIADRIGNHIDGRSEESARIRQYGPVRFSYARVDGGVKVRREVEAALIEAHSPLANR